MTQFKFNYKRVFASVLTLAMISCSNPWDDRTDNGDENLTITLDQAITNTEDVSEFAELLVKSGYDKVLAASRTYTVFVPTNEAMAQVDDAILNDPVQLNIFVRNHITLTAYSSIRANQEDKIRMLGNKFLVFKGSTMIGDATIISPDHYAKNGIFHIVNKALPAKNNIWQYIKSQAGALDISDYLLTLKEFNIYKSDSIGKALSATGLENNLIYYSDSLSNSYLKNVYNVNNENNSYTMFLMQNSGFNEEVEKMKPYLTKTSNKPEIDSTAIYSKYFTLRDMVFPKAYELDELPATLTSRFGVVIPVDKTQIVQQIHLSNGIVYIMKKVDVELKKRLVSTKIEGEKNISFFPTDLRSKIVYREKKDAVTDSVFKDIRVVSPGVSLFRLNYEAQDLFSTTYKVYWKALNERDVDVSQQLRIGGRYNEKGEYVEEIKLFGYMPVPAKSYQELYIGEFTLDQAGKIDLISLIAGTSSTSELTLDYLRFVPQIKQ